VLLNAGGRKVLLNWELAGSDRYFTIKVADVRAAGAFYEIVFGALELSRREARVGVQLELGLAIGRTRFLVSCRKGPGIEQPALSLLAQELDAPFIAVVLPVEDRESIAARAIENGALITCHCTRDAIIIADPFASHWALVERKPVTHRRASALRIQDGKTLH